MKASRPAGRPRAATDRNAPGAVASAASPQGNPPASGAPAARGAGASSSSARPTAHRVLLLGLGNDLLRDDAVGLNVAHEIRRCLADVEGIVVQATAEMGLSLLDYLVGFDDLVVVDAVQTGQAPPGFLHELDGADLKTLPAVSPHFFGLGEVLALGRRLGLPVPRRMQVFAVEVQDPFTVGTSLTPPVQQALPGVVARILAATRQLRRDPPPPAQS